MGTATAEKNREDRLRRRARKQGLFIQKSRRNGTYMVMNENNWLVAAGDWSNGYGLDLDDVEAYLEETV